MDRLERKEAEDTVSRELQIIRAVKTARIRMEEEDSEAIVCSESLDISIKKNLALNLCK